MPNLTIKPLTSEEVEAQIERENELDAVNGGQEPQDQLDAGDGQGDGEGGEPRIEPAPREKPIQMSPQDQKREAMANRFKRPGVDVPFDGDMTRDENLYGSVAQENLEPDPDADEPGVSAEQRAAAAIPAPKMITLKVRGKDVTRSEEEWLALASKVEAADSYMEEGRTLLEAAKEIKAERAGRDPQHPEGRSSTQDDEQDEGNRQQQPRHPGVDLTKVVEKIQFGDPAEAARDLGEAINTAAAQMANEGHVNRLVKNDLAKSQNDLAQFRADNPSLVGDEIASSVIEHAVYKIYRDEIKALGVDEAQIPKDPKALADWHRLYRVHGHTVSRPIEVLNKAKAVMETFRGAPTPKPAPRPKDASRVVVNVDRTERRMAIPQQPSRSVAPRRDAAPVVQQDSRKAAVQEMRRARGQPVVN